jgi:hypothetical protein
MLVQPEPIRTTATRAVNAVGVHCPAGMANLHYPRHRRSQTYRGFDGQPPGRVGVLPSYVYGGHRPSGRGGGRVEAAIVAS